MLFQNFPVLIRGGGDLATGVAYQLHKAGFPLVVFELPRPLVVRRLVALASAVFEGQIVVEDMKGVLVKSLEESVQLAAKGLVPVLVEPELNIKLNEEGQRLFKILVDARMAKHNIDTRKEHASLVIALGPGYFAGEDCHVVIETKRGHGLGRALWQGMARHDTGSPGLVGGRGAERVLRAPTEGPVAWNYDIGQRAAKGTVLGTIGSESITAPFDGAVRGLIYPGIHVRTGQKIGDIDPRNDIEACTTISDKALSIGGGVLGAVLEWLNRQQVEVG